MLALFFALIFAGVAGVLAGNSVSIDSRICVEGNPILRHHCVPVPTSNITRGDQHLKEAVSKAHDVLKKFRARMGFGRALAAPQVGENLRFIVMKLQDSPPRTLYNPVVTEESSDKFTMWDDCLSFPDKMCCVERSKWVTVRFTNEEGKTELWKHCSQDISELLQHELDHLDGILAIDKAVRPPKDLKCESIIPRKDYLDKRQHFDSLVDFHY